MTSTLPERATVEVSTADSFFVRLDESRFHPTEHAGGTWSPEDQHFSTMAGLLVHEMQRSRPATDDKVLGRIAYDILGALEFGACEVSVNVLRPGRTIELVEATATVNGRPVVVARAWYMLTYDSRSVVGGDGPAMTPPEQTPHWPMSSIWGGGYIRALDTRRYDDEVPGAAKCWLSTPMSLVADEEISPLASFIALVDTANGVAPRQNAADWIFPNVDLTIHLHRQPRGPWTGLETTVAWGATGQGVTSTVLHDVDGPVGTAAQMLTVRPSPASSSRA